MSQTNKLECQERLEALTLPTLQHRRFRTDMIETYKITNGHFEDNCVKHLFEMKSTNMRDHQYVIKIIHSKTTTRRNCFALLCFATHPFGIVYLVPLLDQFP